MGIRSFIFSTMPRRGEAGTVEHPHQHDDAEGGVVLSPNSQLPLRHRPFAFHLGKRGIDRPEEIGMRESLVGIETLRLDQ